jgi:hypothetical protein
VLVIYSKCTAPVKSSRFEFRHGQGRSEPVIDRATRSDEREGGARRSRFSHLPADNDTLAPHAPTSPAVLLIAVAVLGAGITRRLREVSTPGTAAVELDAVSLAGDPVPLTMAN